MEDKRAQRGNPSFVWRAGQERRLNLIRRWGHPQGARALVDGCGVGMYVRALVPESDDIHGIDIEEERVAQAVQNAPAARLLVAAAESLPYADNTFDLVLSHEVIEHVTDDAHSAQEMVRVLRTGGRIVLFAPNRLYPFETHGHYWRGRYRFGNTPLVNWLPNPMRDHLVPHVRAYTTTGLLSLFQGLPVRIVVNTQIFPGYDNVIAHHASLGRFLRKMTHTLERTPLRIFALSHLLVVEKEAR